MESCTRPTWRSIHQFKGQSSFYSWLYRIATNVTIETLRRKGVHGEAEFDDRIAPGNEDPTSEQAFVGAASSQKIRTERDPAADSGSNRFTFSYLNDYVAETRR
jgi:DNA-directed RNA polymerase specialized sigma24 family protein